MVPRVEFIETVVAPLGVNGALIPIAGFGATPFIVNSDGTEGAQAAAFAGRTGNTTASSLATNSSGRISYWLDPGDYNVHMNDQQAPPRLSSWIQGFSATTFSIAQILASNSPPPIGGIELFGGAVDPIDGDGVTRWMICNGRAVSRDLFSSLFDTIGTSYGVGDGVTTFNIPDMRGRFPLGKSVGGTGSVLGASGGSLDHTHTVGSHKHGRGTLSAVPDDHQHWLSPVHDATVIAAGYSISDITIGSGAVHTNVLAVTNPVGFDTAVVTQPGHITIPTTKFDGYVGDNAGGDGDVGFPTAGQNPSFMTMNYLVKVL